MSKLKREQACDRSYIYILHLAMSRTLYGLERTVESSCGTTAERIYLFVSPAFLFLFFSFLS